MKADDCLVLVVDDDRVDRERIIRSLGRQYAICEASTGRDGLDMARRLDPGCVLLDYRLGDMEGLELLEQLVRRGLSVVMLTGEGDESLAARAIKAGALDYVTKSASIEQVLEALKGALERTRERRRSERVKPTVERFESLVEVLLSAPIASVRRTCRAAIQVQPEVARHLDPALDELDHLNRHLRTLTLLATAERLCEDRQEVDLAALAPQVRRRLGELPGLDQVAIEIGDLPIVRGAPGALEVLFLELVRTAATNALQNAAQPPRAALETHLMSGSWHVRLSDSGPPPSAAELSHGFTTFGSGTERDLNLVLAARIVHQHEGNIWFEPDSESSGCRLVFTLPVAFGTTPTRPRRP